MAQGITQALKHQVMCSGKKQHTTYVVVVVFASHQICTKEFMTRDRILFFVCCDFAHKKKLLKKYD